MNIAKMFGEKVVFSFEVFPPKKDSGIESIYSTIKDLKELNPDFISVTYGAGGSGAKNVDTAELCSLIKSEYGIETIAHLSCLYNTREMVDEILERLKDAKVDNILALRGDITPGLETQNDFQHASDLAEYIKSKDMGFHISGACYPEVHQEAEDMETDIENLKKKVDAGVDHLISQLFFNNDDFYWFYEQVQKAGINVPLEAGIMPVTNKSQIQRMVSMCGASIPIKLAKLLQRFGDDPIAMRDAGISYAIDQIIDLVASGVDGIHIYTMNDPYVAKKITESVHNIIGSDNLKK